MYIYMFLLVCCRAERIWFQICSSLLSRPASSAPRCFCCSLSKSLASRVAMAPVPLCPSEYMRLLRVLNARAWRGDTAAKALKASWLAAPPKSQVREDILRQQVVPGEGGAGSRFAGKQAFKPARGTQITGLRKATLSEDVVVKCLPTGSTALERTLSVYGYLREIGKEEEAPMPRLLKVVQLPAPKAKAKAKAKANAKAKD